MEEQVSLPDCPQCGGDMYAFMREEAGQQVTIWACRACGSVFAYDAAYRLRPHHLGIFSVACPDCAGDMQIHTGGTQWLCPNCGATIPL